MADRPTLAIVHSLGGCGGTLLARCLGVMPGVVLVSECNPASAGLFNGALNPYTQIANWYPRLFPFVEHDYTAAELERPDRFAAFTRALCDHLHLQGARLVIRDYNYIDYFGVPFVDAPARRSSLIGSLKDDCHVKSCVLIRHPLDQYASLRSHALLRDVLSPQIFLAGYEAFLRDFGEERRHKYEDVLADPVREIAALCESLGLPFTRSFLENFPSRTEVTGNVRRIAERSISRSRRAPIDEYWDTTLTERDEYEHLLVRLGYAYTDT